MLCSNRRLQGRDVILLSLKSGVFDPGHWAPAFALACRRDSVQSSARTHQACISFAGFAIK